MLIIPAIDLEDGCVVRYVQGRLNKRIYSRDPLKVARHWAKSGAKLLHVVDLDGAFSGIPKNLAIVKKIAKSVPIPVEFGGGVRNIESIKMILDSSVARVVLGTRAIQEKEFLKKAFAKFKEKIIVSLDARNNALLVKGWKKANKTDMVSFAGRLKSIGLKELIYTDTLKDGTLKGPNTKGIKDLLKKTGLNIIASGGISCLSDIFKLKKLESQGLTGVIIGKALYEGKFTLQQALRIAK